MTTYTIESADGTSLGQGIQDERKSRGAAEWAADRIADAVCLSDGENSVEIACVPKADIKRLAAEAAEAGDEAQYALCVAALNGDQDARAECGRVIRCAAEAEAM